MTITAITSYSQVTYVTAQSGNFDADATWGSEGAPPTTGACNCKIVIAGNTTVTLNTDVNITNVALVLDAAGSKLVWSTANNRSLVLGGTSSIDVQNSLASIVLTKAGHTINLKGQTIYTGTSAGFNSATAGTVNGLASAASIRANPQFQSGTLPVKLTDFQASGKGSSVIISWKTDLEVNSSHFEIQRSGDSKQWQSIGSVQASGNVSVEQIYAYTDAAPLDGTSYYRLKMIDLDGQFDYSPIKSITFASTALNVVAGPNPASTFLNVSVSQPGREPYRLRLINRAGQVVFDQKYAAANSRLQINVANYADGSYFLEITNNNGLRQINKVMIVRK